MRNTLEKINNNPKLSLTVIVCGKRHIDVAKDIINNTFKFVVTRSDFIMDPIVFMSSFNKEISTILKRIKPDILLLLGDRIEPFIAASVATYLSIPIAHIHGGDISSTVDEHTRHAITKLSHIHFAATEDAKKRIIKMGEDPKHVFNVGAPGLDMIYDKFSYKILTDDDIITVLQHPCSNEISKSGKQMKETLEAVLELSKKYMVFIIYPNNDPGSGEMIKVINRYRDMKNIYITENIKHYNFLHLLKSSKVLIGNSSCGIIEAASLGLPVVNIGTRQNGRVCSENVIHVKNYDRKEILKGINKALNIKKKKFNNVYGNGKAGEKISNILSNIKVDFQKKMGY